MIISVGYRVNSRRGTQFRIWATNLLKQHLIAGYTLNEKRFAAQEAKYQELQNALRAKNIKGKINDTAIDGKTR
jgi:hypothetical protein